MPKKKAPVQPANEEPAQLRRSSRTTRGSVKPLVDLSKDQLSDQVEEPEVVSKNVKDEDVDSLETDNDDDDEEFVEPTKSRRSSQAKSVLAKKKQQSKPLVKAEPKTEKEPKVSSTVSKRSQKSSASKSTKASANVKNEPVKDDGDEDKYVEVHYELSEKEMKEINHAFNINCSDDGEEQLEIDGLKTAIRSLGFEPRSNEIQILFAKFSNKKGKINRDSFHKIMAFKMASLPGTNHHGDMSNEISRVFNLIDIDRTGFITLENLKSIAQELNEEISEEEMKEMIMEADLDGDDQISQQEFYNIMKKTSLY